MLKNTNMVSILLLVVFLYPIIRGFFSKFSSFAKADINGLAASISLIIAVITGIYCTQKIFIRHDTAFIMYIFSKIPQVLMNYITSNPLIIYVIIAPILTIIFYNIIWRILKIINVHVIYPIIDSLESVISRLPQLLRRLINAVLQVPRAVCFLLIAALILNLYSVFNKDTKLNGELSKSSIYNRICQQVIIPVTNSNIAKKLPSVINNSFKIQVKEGNANESVNRNNADENNKAVVYYNGVTLDQGVESNSSINLFAKNLTASQPTVKQKARKIYTWIGQNISYDESKANRVLNNDFSESSGAIPTFENRKGICFDYACLYVAMCRSCNIKVRLITGQGFNGVNWVSHAWNEVYIPDENKWIDVDSTFYRGGDYFDSIRFKIDHKDADTVGEW